MTVSLDKMQWALGDEPATEVTVSQYLSIMEGESVVVDGQVVTADDGPFRIVHTEAVERATGLPSSPFDISDTGIELDPGVGIGTDWPTEQDPATADVAYIYASLSSSPPLIRLQQEVSEHLDAAGAAYDLQDPEKLHITLLYIERIDNHELTDLISHIQWPSAFTVDGLRIGTFREAEDKPVALMINPDNALLRMQRQLYERAISMGVRVSEFSIPGQYKPHVTLAYDLEPPEQELLKLDAPVRLTVDSVVVTRPDYRVARVIRLPGVPGGAAFVVRQRVPDMFQRMRRTRQNTIAQAFDDVRRYLGDLVAAVRAQGPDREEYLDREQDRRRIKLPDLPPVQDTDIVSLGYTPVTMAWSQFGEGVFDYMRRREDALRRRHQGPGPHPGTGTPQEAHAGDGVGAEGGLSEVESADDLPPEPQGQRPFDERLRSVGSLEDGEVSAYYGEMVDRYSVIYEEIERLKATDSAEDFRRAQELTRQVRKKMFLDSLAVAENEEVWLNQSKEDFQQYSSVSRQMGEFGDEISPRQLALMDMASQRKKAWTFSVERALSRGDARPERVEELGYHSNDPWEPLERTLYHVTTAASAVAETGLKSRLELGMDRGVGLGGGDDRTISFTDDPEVARTIEASIHEARMVAAGEIEVDDILEAAAEAPNADRPFVDDVIQTLSPRDYDEGDYERGEIPQVVDELQRGVRSDHMGLGTTLDEYQAKHGDEWEVSPHSRSWEGGDGKTRYTMFERPMSEEERREARFGLWKNFSAMRQSAGGAYDPTFFLTDVHALAEIDPGEIKTVQLEPKPGAHGMRMGALGEIRTVGAEGLEQTDIYDSVDPDEVTVERHYGPGPHPGTGTPQTEHAANGGRGGDGELGKVVLEQSPVKTYNFDADEEEFLRLAEQVYAEQTPEVQAKIDEARRMIEEGETTQSIYKDPETGEYTPARQLLHEEIISEVIGDTAPAEERPTILMTGGFPGAGKSSVFRMLEAQGEDFSNYVHIDSDAIKERLPEYEGWNAALTHQEASDIVDEIVYRAARDRKNIIYDATMKTTENAEKLVGLFEDTGYDSRVVFVDVPIEEAMRRATHRFATQGGRFVDNTYIATHDHKNVQSLDAIKPMVDQWEHWNNDVPLGDEPILVASSEQQGADEEESDAGS